MEMTDKQANNAEIKAAFLSRMRGVLSGAVWGMEMVTCSAPLTPAMFAPTCPNEAMHEIKFRFPDGRDFSKYFCDNHFGELADGIEVLKWIDIGDNYMIWIETNEKQGN